LTYSTSLPGTDRDRDWPRAEIGPGLRINHGGNVVIKPGTRIGDRCTIMQGVTLGIRRYGERPPIIGDRVEIGAYCQVFGAVTVGDAARLGALSLVIDDVSPGATVAGIPARELRATPGLAQPAP
jgi:serine O-acetyltransferase